MLDPLLVHLTSGPNPESDYAEGASLRRNRRRCAGVGLTTDRYYCCIHCACVLLQADDSGEPVHDVFRYLQCVHCYSGE